MRPQTLPGCSAPHTLGARRARGNWWALAVPAVPPQSDKPADRPQRAGGTQRRV